MDFKFLHAADIHLDSPLRGLSQYGDVPADVVRTATRDALDNLVTRAIDEQVGRCQTKRTSGRISPLVRC